MPTSRTRLLGTFHSSLAEEFWRAVSSAGLLNLHVVLHHGHNTHHIIEAIFKATARALREATELDSRGGGGSVDEGGALIIWGFQLNSAQTPFFDNTMKPLSNSNRSRLLSPPTPWPVFGGLLMKTFCRLFAISLTLLLAASPSKAAKMRFELCDESIIIGDVDDSFVFEVETAYGVLKIPACDIASIDVGYHLTDEETVVVAKAIKDLGSKIFREREDAMQALIKYGQRPYRLVREADISDLEVKERIEKYVNKTNPDSNKLTDAVTAKDVTASGKILTKVIPMTTATLGQVKIPVAHLIRIGTGSDVKVVVQPDADWQEIKGGKLLKNAKFEITAKGSVDLWPQQPGPYLTGPNGYQVPGKGGVYRAGKLIGKIGVSGAVFEIGEKYSLTVSESGPLYLKIVESPWNCNSSGQFEVRISR